MTLDRVKLGRAVTFMKYAASVVSLIFLPKTLILNKIMFLPSTSLNLAGLVVNELPIYHCLMQIFQELVTKDLDNFNKSPHQYSPLFTMK